MFKSLCQKSNILIISLALSFLFVFILNSGLAGAAETTVKDTAVETQTQDDTSSANVSNEKEADKKESDGLEAESPDSADVSEKSESASASPDSEDADTEEANAGKKESELESSMPSEQKLQVDVPKANVRSEASLKAKINTQLNKGEAVIVLQTKDDWYHVQLSNGDTGWVHKDLFKEATPADNAVKPGDTAKITVSAGNIRKEPSQEAEILVQLKKGKEITIIETQEDWFKVGLDDGQTGWAHKILFARKMKKGDHLLQGIRIEAGDNNEEKIFFIFEGVNPPKTFFSKTGSKRIVCDFPNTRLDKGIKQKIDVNGKLIQCIRTGLHNDNEDARIVFDLVADQEYELQHIFVKGQVYMLIVKKV